MRKRKYAPFINVYQTAAHNLIWNKDYKVSQSENNVDLIFKQYSEVISMMKHLASARDDWYSKLLTLNIAIGSIGGFLYDHTGLLKLDSIFGIICFMGLMICLFWYFHTRDINKQITMFFAQIEELEDYLPARTFGNNIVNIRTISGDKSYMHHYKIQYVIINLFMFLYICAFIFKIFNFL